MTATLLHLEVFDTHKLDLARLDLFECLVWALSLGAGRGFLSIEK